MDFKSGVEFQDDMGRKYQIRELRGELWLLYWNKAYESFTTLRRIDTVEAEQMLWRRPRENEQTSADGVTTFNLRCTMKTRWVPHFLAMLRRMENYGANGMSRRVGMYADGDGDFQPKFQWDKSLPSDAEPVKEVNGDCLFDAG